MNKVLAGQVVHAVGYLPAEGEELCGQGGRDGDGRGRRGTASAVSLGRSEECRVLVMF